MKMLKRLFRPILLTLSTPKLCTIINLRVHLPCTNIQNMKTFKPIIFSAVSILLAAKTFALVPLDISKVQNVEINPSALKTAVCTALKNKIEAKITNYDENRGKHQEMYTKLVDRLTQKIADWKAMGYDVDKLEKDLEILTAKVDTFKSDYVKFIDALKATQNISCGTDTEFKSK